MNEVAFWLSIAVSIGFVGAYFLPAIVAMYRLENRIVTCSLSEPEKAERRDSFEAQLSAFLERERRDGYRPVEIGWHLLGRMVSTLPSDIWDGSRPLLIRAYWSFVCLRVNYRLWLMQRFFSKLDRRAHAANLRAQASYRDMGIRFNLATAPAQFSEDEQYFLTGQSSQASLDAANQIVLRQHQRARHWTGLREAYISNSRARTFAPPDLTGAQNPPYALLHPEQGRMASQREVLPRWDGPRIEPAVAMVLPDTTG